MTGPSLSPENRFDGADGTVAQLCMGPTMDIEIVRELFTHVHRGGAHRSAMRRRLPARRLPTAARRLPPLADRPARPACRSGPRTSTSPSPGHRHISHLFALHPGDQITPARHAGAGRRGARVARSAGWRTAAGTPAGAAPGSSTSGRACRTATRPSSNLQLLLGKVDAAQPVRHPPAVPDRRQLRRRPPASPRCCCRATRDHALLPALPKPGARVGSLACAPAAAFEVDIAWRGGKLASAEIRSLAAGECCVQLPQGAVGRAINAGVEVARPGQRLSFPTTAGAAYVIAVE